MDYRILAFILSARLQGVIESIVSPDQTAYIKNRYMGNNIRLVEDILEYYDHMEKKGLIFNVRKVSSLIWSWLLFRYPNKETGDVNKELTLRTLIFMADFTKAFNSLE